MISRTAGFLVASGLFSLVSCVAACSGANSSDLFGEPQPGNGQVVFPTDPAPGSSGTSGTSGSSGSSGSVKDAGTDSAPAWKSPGVYCGADLAGDDVYCTPGTSLCCARSFSGGGGGGDNHDSYECTANNAGACQGGAPIRCNDRTDCAAGQVCCGAFDPNEGYRSVQCQTSCNSTPIPGTTPVRFCDPDAPVDECTSIGKTCTASGSLPGFSICK